MTYRLSYFSKLSVAFFMFLIIQKSQTLIKDLLPKQILLGFGSTISQTTTIQSRIVKFFVELWTLSNHSSSSDLGGGMVGQGYTQVLLEVTDREFSFDIHLKTNPPKKVFGNIKTQIFCRYLASPPRTFNQLIPHGWLHRWSASLSSLRYKHLQSSAQAKVFIQFTCIYPIYHYHLCVQVIF